MTLNEIVEHVATSPSWEVESSGEDIVVTVTLASGRIQRVRLSEIEVEGNRYIHLTSSIGTRPSLDAGQLRAMLSLNLRSPHGAFALHGDLLLITEVLPISIDPQILRSAIWFLATHADRYEEQIFGHNST